MSVEIEKELLRKARTLNRTIVFPEAEFSERIRQASLIILKEKIANVVFIGNAQKISKHMDISNIKIVDPFNNPNLFNELANKIYEKRKSKGVSKEQAIELCSDPIYFANAYVACGYADGIVCGAEVSTAKTLKPALQIIKSQNCMVSSYFLFSGENSVTDNEFLMGDCAVIENPTAEQECLIADDMLKQYKLLGLKNPKVAFLSYSTMGSAKGESIDKVNYAYKLFTELNPKVDAVGEIQFDASVKKSVALTKMPNCQFTRPANIFVMPNLDAGNICYKMVQQFGGLKAIGPITMGFNKPVNDLSRGCSVNDIVLLTAITCIQV